MEIFVAAPYQVAIERIKEALKDMLLDEIEISLKMKSGGDDTVYAELKGSSEDIQLVSFNS